MVPMKCPLDLQSNVKLIDSISISMLKLRYLHQLAIRLPDEFLNKGDIFIYESEATGYRFYFPFDLAGGADFYDQLSVQNWYYLASKWEYTTALKLIDGSASVLEVGCGAGDFLKLLDTDCQKIGLEINASAITKARDLGLEVLNETIEEHANKGRQYEVVCLFQVLEHIPDVNSFLTAASKCLASGGKMIICVPNNDSFIKNDSKNPLNMPPHHMGLWNSQSLAALEPLFGLKLISLKKEPLQQYHVDWYVKTLLIKLFGDRLYYHIIRRVGISSVVRKIVTLNRERIIGHSILAVYQKI
jgi:SAM-dependent methyltransferase